MACKVGLTPEKPGCSCNLTIPNTREEVSVGEKERSVLVCRRGGKCAAARDLNYVIDIYRPEEAQEHRKFTLSNAGLFRLQVAFNIRLTTSWTRSAMARHCRHMASSATNSGSTLPSGYFDGR